LKTIHSNGSVGSSGGIVIAVEELEVIILYIKHKHREKSLNCVMSFLMLAKRSRN